jgi:2,3-diketo-5-methylthio-1-phosphopentane phosphatase/HAD superfamily hydrolase (TIGR01549 family)
MNTQCPRQYQRNGRKILILCDFDGTVSTKDTVNHLVREHVTSPEWRVHVKRYMRGEIGSREVYEAVGPSMRMTPEDLESFVQRHAELDAAFPAFLDWAQTRGIDVKIVSDGFDATILTLFRNHGLVGLDVFANSLVLGEDGRVTIRSPHTNPDCGKCGTCKLGIIRRFRKDYDRIVLIGDGESDRHAAEGADAVIALKELFVYCARTGIPAIRADGFEEIPFLLTRQIRAVAFDMDGTLVDSLESIADAFNHMFSALGYPLMTVEQVARHTSISLKDFVSKFFPAQQGELAVKIFRDYYKKFLREKTQIMPHAMEALQAIDGTVVKGVVTNKRGEYARRVAEHLGFADQMARIIGAEDGFPAKPAPDMFAEFIRSTGATSGSTIYVGDSPVDVEAATNAGIDAFALSGPIFSGEELALHRPRRVLRRISELPAALEPVV